MGDFLETNEDLPEEVENKYAELFAVYLMSLTRNLSSKFYTKKQIVLNNKEFVDWAGLSSSHVS